MKRLEIILLLIIFSFHSYGNNEVINNHCDGLTDKISEVIVGDSINIKKLEANGIFPIIGEDINFKLTQCRLSKRIIIKSNQNTGDFIVIEFETKSINEGYSTSSFENLIKDSCSEKSLYTTIRVEKKNINEIKDKLNLKYCKNNDSDIYHSKRFSYRQEDDFRHQYFNKYFAIPLEIGSSFPFLLYKKMDQRALFQNAIETQEGFQRLFYLYRADIKGFSYIESSTFSKTNHNISTNPTKVFKWSLQEDKDSDLFESEIKFNSQLYKKEELKSALFELIHKESIELPSVYFLGKRVYLSKRELYHRIIQYMSSEIPL
ncbi:hypothetical protein BALOs_0848 [Halobacteriovorax sp. BALOs_7]|uniref:hypothetical protein n=1 Tax=Halobacteriovorax sp. BALOs_7 TaxID=2109558 RepID=UPI000EA1ACDA|nr:hypothetical protein [Halobacteriovorax sp. BALOs_7]AYF43858.1 hypothetical protein BALOs_0848 [Halobacteriovorax sp. BALOs_7]